MIFILKVHVVWPGIQISCNVKITTYIIVYYKATATTARRDGDVNIYGFVL